MPLQLVLDVLERAWEAEAQVRVEARFHPGLSLEGSSELLPVQALQLFPHWGRLLQQAFQALLPDSVELLLVLEL